MTAASAESGWLRSSRLICRSSSSLAASASFLSSRLLTPAADLLGEVVALAELLLDRLELLAQEVLALRLVHLVARVGGDLLLHGEQLHLAPAALR